MQSGKSANKRTAFSKHEKTQNNCWSLADGSTRIENLFQARFALFGRGSLFDATKFDRGILHIQVKRYFGHIHSGNIRRNIGWNAFQLDCIASPGNFGWDKVGWDRNCPWEDLNDPPATPLRLNGHTIHKWNVNCPIKTENHINICTLISQKIVTLVHCTKMTSSDRLWFQKLK